MLTYADDLAPMADGNEIDIKERGGRYVTKKKLILNVNKSKVMMFKNFNIGAGQIREIVKKATRTIKESCREISGRE